MPAAGLLLAWAASAPDAVAARSRLAYLVYDPADLGAFAQRGANAAERLPGRTDEPHLLGPERFAAALDGPPPEPSPRFFLEYPPPALALFRLEAWAVGLTGLPPAAADAFHTDVAHHLPRTDAEREVWGRLRAATRLHVALMAAALVALLRVLRPGPAAWLLVLPGAMYFSLLRYDVLPALATAVAFGCADRKRWGWAGVWLAVGVGLKLYPVLFLPVLLRLAAAGVSRDRKGAAAGGRSDAPSSPAAAPLRSRLTPDWLRFAAGFTTTLALLAAASVAAVGVEGSLAPLRVQLGRALEDGWGLYGRLLPTALAYSSAGRLGLLAAVVLACCWTRPADLDAARRRCGLVLLAFTQLAVFWSPQWLVWFLPLAVPLAAKERRTAWAVLAVDATGYLSFPVLWHLVWGHLPAEWRPPVTETLIALRSLAWAWLGWRFLRGGPRLPAAGFRVEALREAVTPPRGLKWRDVSRSGPPLMRGTTALQPVTVTFEPLPDGGLEDVPQAREPRQAVAVYAWDGAGWRPTGKLVFNLSAEELVQRLGERPA